MSKLTLYIFFLGIITSCNPATQRNNHWYSDAKKGDLWRFPLVNPYEIVSPTNSENDWFLIIKNPNISGRDYWDIENKYEFQLSQIDSIGIRDSVIVLKSRSSYWPKLSGDFKTTLIIDVRTGTQFLFSDIHHKRELDQKLRELNLSKLNVYHFRTIKDTFQDSPVLPKEWPRN